MLSEHGGFFAVECGQLSSHSLFSCMQDGADTTVLSSLAGREKLHRAPSRPIDLAEQ